VLWIILPSYNESAQWMVVIERSNTLGRLLCHARSKFIAHSYPSLQGVKDEVYSEGTHLVVRTTVFTHLYSLRSSASLV
jgi:hypothetical protein